MSTPGAPVVSVVGLSGSGKTTLLERVIAILSGRGLRVGVIKHHAHDVELDVPKKDSWRHAQAGAVATIVSGPRQFALVRRVERERTLEELVALVGDVDIVLAEGFRASGGTCVEVVRRERSSHPSCELQDLAALVTDIPPAEFPAEIADAVRAGRPRLFGLDDAEGLADAIVRGSL